MEGEERPPLSQRWSWATNGVAASAAEVLGQEAE